jgi:hypothetical protein
LPPVEHAENEETEGDAGDGLKAETPANGAESKDVDALLSTLPFGLDRARLKVKNVLHRMVINKVIHYKVILKSSKCFISFTLWS